MPARQPFTALCQALHRPVTCGRADLHIHSTYSDGAYTPAEVVDLARRSGLAAVAITDHDTLDGVAIAQAAARGTGVEIVPGIEITTEDEERELHLLAYFVRLDDSALNAALGRLGAHRLARFRDMIQRLQSVGVSIDERDLDDAERHGVLGRRHVANLLVKARKAGSVREAFQRYLGDGNRFVAPKLRLPIAEAITLVREAGGVASWAHPSYHCTRESLGRLRDLGLQAVEANYPSFRETWKKQLHTWAGELGLAITGGSDCHGPDHHRRSIGVASITADELDTLRSRCDLTADLATAAIQDG